MKRMNIEEKIVKILMETGRKIATAESCTGGMVAARLVNVPGVSDVFEAGYITYANAAKERILQVSGDTLRRFGAVSARTAEEMALGAAQAAHAHCSIATTGIAGPGGGTPEKPVGLVYIACLAGEKVQVRKCLFEGERQAVREQATQAALEFMLEQLQVSGETP